ncbi:MAG: TetR/AcrR family transcriptional regulator [Deltaproteobacteria bacterium]|jgi:AcrR family transcriptional regulator|nr:TetR/AcrR family transcriptional regulator [Deltaproteobacteria bacterium]
MTISSLNRYRPAGRPPKHPEGQTSIRISILEQAILVFAEKGIPASTLAEISQRVRITPATLYYHFASREQLIEQTLEYHLVPLIRYIWQAALEVAGPLAMLDEFQKRMLFVANSSPWFLPLWSRELASEGGTLRAFLAAKIPEGASGKFLEKIRQGQTSGAINPRIVPELLFISLIGGVYVPLLAKKNWEQIFNAEIPQERALEHIQSLLTEGLTCRKEP